MFTLSSKWKIKRFSNKQTCDSLIREREITFFFFFNSKKGFYFKRGKQYVDLRRINRFSRLFVLNQ